MIRVKNTRVDSDDPGRMGQGLFEFFLEFLGQGCPATLRPEFEAGVKFVEGKANKFGIKTHHNPRSNQVRFTLIE